MDEIPAVSSFLCQPNAADEMDATRFKRVYRYGNFNRGTLICSNQKRMVFQIWMRRMFGENWAIYPPEYFEEIAQFAQKIKERFLSRD